MEQLGLQDSKPVSTPGVDTAAGGGGDDEGSTVEEELPPAEATLFRGIAARCNYLQPDRPDIQFAVEECCRLMSRPTPRAWELLKRVGRYRKGRPGLVWKYDWQSPVKILDVHSDANWAGCRESRKSSSGGTIALGGHLIRSYSKTQSVIAKSSGESELYAVVRASSGGTGNLDITCGFWMNRCARERRHGRQCGDRHRATQRHQQAQARRGGRAMAPRTAGTKAPAS